MMTGAIGVRGNNHLKVTLPRVCDLIRGAGRIAEMADQQKATESSLPEAGYPRQDVITIFADGVTSYSPTAQTVRFYLSRLEPNFIVSEPNKVVVIGQVIMPLAGFIHTAEFFKKAVLNLLSNGTITQEQINAITGNSK
jgi:capsule polysaccharide modification protein KpsS